MSQFSYNLSLLRRRAGYTQEGLAEALGVSRQAVSKWESGQTLPEAATLLTLADLLHCTLDQLMREALPDDGPADEEEARRIAEEEADYALFEAYDAHMNRFAAMMAAGVALVLAGVAGLLLCYLLFGGTGYIVLPLFFCLAAAVFIFGGMAHSDFQKRCPQIPNYYTPEEIARFRRSSRVGIALSVSALVLDVALLVALATLFLRDPFMQILSVVVFLLIIGGSVGVLVLLGILGSKYDLDQYAASAAEQF